MSNRSEFTIDEIMQDSMTRLLMKADRVDPIAFEAKLRAAVGSNSDVEADAEDDADEGMQDDLVRACVIQADRCCRSSQGMGIHR